MKTEPFRLYIAPQSVSCSGERIARIMRGSTVYSWRTFLLSGPDLVAAANIWFTLELPKLKAQYEQPATLNIGPL